MTIPPSHADIELPCASSMLEAVPDSFLLTKYFGEVLVWNHLEPLGIHISKWFMQKNNYFLHDITPAEKKREIEKVTW